MADDVGSDYGIFQCGGKGRSHMRHRVGSVPPASGDGCAMILVAIGSNLPGRGLDGPLAVCREALREIAAAGLQVLSASPWYESEPVPRSSQPWFVNGVARVASDLSAEAILARLHAIEAAFGRQRGAVNAARILDLDLLCHGDLIRETAPVLPHPRLRQRAFVLLPLRDVAPGWRHPVDGAGVDALIADLPPGQRIRPITGG